MGTRIKGQETAIYVNNNGVTQQFNDVKDFDIDVELALLQEGYVGQTSDQYDEILKGVQGNMTMHAEGPAAIDFATAIVNRATRRVPGLVVNVQSTLYFPNGVTRRISINNVFWGAIPMTVSGRADYVAWKLNWKGSFPIVI